MKKKLIKVLAITLCAVALVTGSIAATVAYLAMKTAPVQNTFTAGDINITLDAAALDFKMVPGQTYTVAPTVTVTANSEKCYLFVKFDEVFPEVQDPDFTLTFADYLTYSVATGEDGWKALAGEDGVYYRVVETPNNDTAFDVTATVTAVSARTKEDYKALNDQQPKLNVTAYAVQFVGMADAAAAWAQAKTLG